MKSVAECLQQLLDLWQIVGVHRWGNCQFAELLDEWELQLQVRVVLVDDTGTLSLLFALLALDLEVLLVYALKSLNFVFTKHFFDLFLLFGLSRVILSRVNVLFGNLAVSSHTEVDELLAEFHVLGVRMHLNSLQLLALILGLAFCVFLLASLDLFLTLLLPCFTFGLVLLSLFLSLAALLLVSIGASLALKIGLLCLLQPDNVLN